LCPRTKSAGCFVVEDSLRCGQDERVDVGRRRLAGRHVRPHRRVGDLDQREAHAPNAGREVVAELGTRERAKHRAGAVVDVGGPLGQVRRPVAGQEVLAAVQQQQPGLGWMPAHPRRRVQRRGVRVAGLHGLDPAGLEAPYQVEPQGAQQHVAAWKAVIQRAGGGAGRLGDRADRRRSGATLGGHRRGSGEEVLLGETCRAGHAAASVHVLE
jgi:hypothetical protein